MTQAPGVSLARQHPGGVPWARHGQRRQNTQHTGCTMTLQDKVAIVTGGSRGIGRAICLGLTAQGARVVVAARTEIDTSAGAAFAR
jgi:3-oxoacyl-ACP reductase-like protein